LLPHAQRLLAYEQRLTDGVESAPTHHLQSAVSSLQSAAAGGSPVWGVSAEEELRSAKQALARADDAIRMRTATGRANRSAQAIERALSGNRTPGLANRSRQRSLFEEPIATPLRNIERILAQKQQQSGREQVAVLSQRGGGHEPGRIIATGSGETDAIDMPPGARGNIVTHTHPTDMPFSVPDAQAAIAGGVSAMRVVGPHATYTLQPGASGHWPDVGAVTRSYTRHLAASTSRIRTMTPRATAALADYLPNHLAWRGVARELGLRYTRQLRNQNP
jgi:hypothetical protein